MTERKHLIGGTDAADLLGIGKTSPVALYMKLRGEIPDDFEGNTATAAGKLFEDRVAVDLVRQELGLELVRPRRITLVDPEESRIGCSLDFDVLGQGMQLNRDVGEIKLTGSRKMWGELDKVPPSVAAQAQFQMAVGRRAGRIIPVVHVIAMFVPGFIVEDFPVEEDQEVGDALIGAARDMLEHVDSGDAPPATSGEDARKLFLGRRGLVHACTDEQISLLKQLKEAKNGIAFCQEQVDSILDALLPAFGDATEIANPHTGEILATWRPNEAFDDASFMAAHPELAPLYSKGTSVTKLREDHPSIARMFTGAAKPGKAVRPFKLTKALEEK